MKEEKITAIVQSIIKGPHGKYAVASSRAISGSITFSLGKDVWEEAKEPEPGFFVVLSKVHKKRAGWRAYKARFLSLQDYSVFSRKEVCRS